MFKGTKLWNLVSTYTKVITTVWLMIWVETILFSQLAAIFNFCNEVAIQCINDDVIQVGIIICEFYFGKAAIENIAKGIESYKLAKEKDASENITETNTKAPSA